MASQLLGLRPIALKTFGMTGLNTRSAACLKEAAQSLVPECLDQGTSVSCCASRNKRPNARHKRREERASGDRRERISWLCYAGYWLTICSSWINLLPLSNPDHGETQRTYPVSRHCAHLSGSHQTLLA